MRSLFVVAGLALSMVGHHSSYAALIPVSSVTTNAGTDDGTRGGPIENLINGAGLSGTGAGASHGNDPRTMWYSGPGRAGAQIDFDLGAGYLLNSISLYRYNSGLDPFAVVYRFDLSVSMDGLNFTRALTYCCGGTVGVGKVDLDPDVVAFSGATIARYVRFDGFENWGSPRIGFSEVRFFGDLAGDSGSGQVPVPGTVWLLLAAAVGARRRRNT